MHNLIVGVSGTGKTNLAKALAARFADSANIVVFDPVRSTGWPDKAVKFTTPEKFFEYIETAESAYVFVDEAKTLWDYDTKEADKLVYRRRHQGLLIFLIAQRTRMVPPNARNQCTKVFAFKQQLVDSDILAQEYTNEFNGCVTLPAGEFIVSDSFNVEFFELDYTDYPPEIKKQA